MTKTIRRSSRRALTALGMLLTAMAFSLVAQTESAFALCSTPPERGVWTNVDTASPGIAKIELRDCQSLRECSGNICSITYDVAWTMRVWGKCSPTDCDWGWAAPRKRLSDGRIYGYYDQGYAKRYVYAAMSSYRPGQLWVYWKTDFVDPARQDYDKQEWFRKIAP